MTRRQVYPLHLGGVDFKPYVSQASGRWIDSPTKERDEVARTRTVIDEPGVVTDIRRNREAHERRAEAAVEEAVERTYSALSLCGKGLPA